MIFLFKFKGDVEENMSVLYCFYCHAVIKYFMNGTNKI